MALASITALITTIGGIIGLTTKFYTNSVRHRKVDNQRAKDNVQLIAQLTNKATVVPARDANEWSEDIKKSYKERDLCAGDHTSDSFLNVVDYLYRNNCYHTLLLYNYLVHIQANNAITKAGIQAIRIIT